MEIGHLREIAEQYAYGDGAEGAFRRLANQIADQARKNGPGAILVSFERPYDFGDVEFSHGHGVVRGEFDGTVEDRSGMLRIAGNSWFEFSDRFEDPLDIGIEPGGAPYAITGAWTASFTAEIFKDPARSQFTSPGLQ